jgi:hypothetical protein
MKEPKIRIVVEMFGGTVDAVWHIGGPPQIEVIVTEGAKYAEGEKPFVDAAGCDRAVIAHHALFSDAKIFSEFRIFPLTFAPI